MATTGQLWPRGNWCQTDSGTPYSSTVLADAPSAYWRFEETGTTISDSSGNGKTLTLSSVTGAGAAAMKPALGKCWDAPGSTYGSGPNDSVATNSPFSVEAWVTPDDVSSYRCVISRDNQSSSPRGWNLYIKTGKLMMLINGGAETSGSTTMVVGTTYHVAMTYDGTTAKSYLNGVQEATLATGANHIFLPIIVGASWAGSLSLNFFYDGKIDEVAYYNYAIGQNRLLAHYNAGIA